MTLYSMESRLIFGKGHQFAHNHTAHAKEACQPCTKNTRPGATKRTPCLHEIVSSRLKVGATRHWSRDAQSLDLLIQKLGIVSLSLTPTTNYVAAHLLPRSAERFLMTGILDSISAARKACSSQSMTSWPASQYTNISRGIPEAMRRERKRSFIRHPLS